MNNSFGEWASAIWIGTVWFITANIEALPGVWVAAFGGGLLSAMQTDKQLGRLIVHLVLGVAVGIAFSKLLVEFVKLNDPSSSRVAVSFLTSFFAERIVGSIDRALSKGDIISRLTEIFRRPGK